MKVISPKSLLFLFLWLPWLANLEAAQIRVVKKADGGKHRLTLDELRVSGEMGKAFQATLRHNLERSGWFEMTSDRNAGIGVSGTASGTEAALRADITVAMAGNRFTWHEQTAEGLQGTRHLAHQLNDEIVRRVTGRPGIASSRVVTIGKHDGSDLYVCDADGYGLYRLTQDRVPCLAPNWDPTSAYIFYTSYLQGFPCIYRVPAAGGRRQPLAKFTGLNTGGSVSPDQKLMALILSISGNPELYVLNLSTRNLTRLTNTPRAVEASPDWSPDGQSIVYVSDVSGTPQLYVIHATDKQPKRLTYRGSQNVAPDWGPDGRIAYCSRRQGYQIAVLDPTTGEDELLTSGPDHEDPSWAPDARHIVCARREASNRSSLYVLDTMGDPPIRLFTRDGNWTSPDWSAR